MKCGYEPSVGGCHDNAAFSHIWQSLRITCRILELVMCAQHHRHLIWGPKTVYGNRSWKNIHIPILLRYFFFNTR
jgi:hypothetical protein